LPYLVLAALVVLFFWDSFFAGKILCMRDMFCDFVPWRQFARSAIGEGALPFWNPYSRCGQPFIACPQSAVFYPLNLPFYVLPAAPALKLSLALHLFIAAASTYALMRHWRMSPAAAMLSAVSFAFGTYILAVMEFLSILATAVWSPLTLLCMSRSIERWHEAQSTKPLRERLRRLFPDVLVLSLVFSLQYLAGYPQVMLYTLLLTFLYSVARPLSLRSVGTLLASVSAYVAAGILALGLCMPQFLMTHELVNLSIRARDFDPHLEMASMPARHLLTLVFPFLFGEPGYPDAWWAPSIFEFWVGTCYVGIVPLIFLVFSVWWLRTPWKNVQSRMHLFLFLFFLGVGTAGLLMAAGKYTGVYMFFYNHVPVFNQMRWPSKSLQLVACALPVLAGLGYQAVLSRRAEAKTSAWQRYRAAATGSLLVIFLLLVGGVFVAQRGKGFFEWLTGGAFRFESGRFQNLFADYRLSILWLGLGLIALMLAFRKRSNLLFSAAVVISITYINLFVVGRRIHFVTGDDIYDHVPKAILSLASKAGEDRVHSVYCTSQQDLYGSRDRELFKWARLASVGESCLPLRISKTWGGGPLFHARYLHVFQLLSRLPPEESERLSDLLNIRYVIHGAPFEKILTGEVPRRIKVMERPSCLPRAFVVARWTTIEDWREALSKMIDPSFEPSREAVVESEPASKQLTGETTSAGQVQSIAYGWNRVQLDVEASRPALLVLNDLWYPDWRVTVDGEFKPLLRANVLFRGVRLEPGSHKVVFKYVPRRFRAGVIVTLVTAVFMFAGLIACTRTSSGKAASALFNKG
jgi:hypothetical protein